MITNYKKKFMITSINMEIIRIGQSLKFESSEVTIAKVLKTTITEEILLTTEKSIIKYIPLHTTYSKEVFQNETTAEIKSLPRPPMIPNRRRVPIL